MTCRDDKGFMDGRIRKRKWDLKHKSPSCVLFMSAQLFQEGGPVSKRGWGNSQDKPTNKSPYGCPKGHFYTDVAPPANNSKRSVVQSPR